MNETWTRRSLLLGGGALAMLGAGPAGGSGTREASAAPHERLPGFPRQEAAAVRETVGASHGNFDRVRELVGSRPALAKATWDWGFGDWESALGAASHTGQRDIALFLLEHGARPTLFSAAMLGQLEVVQAMVVANPGAQRISGPHGIPLLRHAELGGEAAKQVVDYLRSLGDADQRPPDAPLGEQERQELLGSFVADGEPIELELVEMRQGGLGFRAGEGFPRGLSHRGGWDFRPAGADAVRIQVLRVEGGLQLVVHDPGPVLTAFRRAPVS